ncbi:MAG TPA: response regulator [Polyangiaceae bacterium]|nr:response regulator [Polyangiaceae bacterium]
MADPFKYFRVEAREILEQLQRGLLELERAVASAENVPRLLRLAHTLKGAARVVKQAEIAQLSHQLEDVLVPLREGPREATADEAERLLGLVDAIGQKISALAPAPAAPPAGAAQAAPAPPLARAAAPERAAADDVVHPQALPASDIDALMDGVVELGFQLGSGRRALPSIERSRSLAEQLGQRLDARRRQDFGPAALAALRSLASELTLSLAKVGRELSTSLEQATRELGQVRDGVDRLRLVSAASMFGTLERATRDAARSLGKQAVFEAKSTEVRLDAEVLTAVQRALLQAVRNAVAHGIEAAAERSSRGKPAQGRVTLEVSRRGQNVCFICQDDGRGVNLADVRREAERLGRLPPGAPGVVEPSQEELLSLLLQGGISTSGAVTEVAGRGVGLDLIREALAGVGGRVSLQTKPGHGTTLELSVPASLSALEALIVEAGGQLYALPLEAVVHAARVLPAELSRSADALSMLHDGQLVRFTPLARLLRRIEQERRSDSVWSVVVVRGERGLLALGVERLLGAESIVCRSLPDSALVDPTVAAVTLDADGNPRLLLDPESLQATAQLTPLPQAHADAPRRVVLVIDDSLTTRMLEQSILESAGYEVDLATSGEQGLEKARARRYDLLLVDVEMPGMDGFTFVEEIRADPHLARTPTVLVTSRASTEDLARGRAAGANAHIAKGEFDQLDFLERIGRLVR